MRADLEQRLAGFGLALHEEKTRLIEFGRLPALARRRRRERRPQTFAFLGFTHYCGWTRDGRFIVKQKTQSRRLTRKLTALRKEAWRLMHAPLARAASLVCQCAARSLRHAAQSRALSGFRQAVRRHLVQLPPAAKPAEPTHGLGHVRGSDRALPSADASDHPSLVGANGVTRVTLGKSRVRESRTPGSVRAKAEWLSYSTSIAPPRADRVPGGLQHALAH
jgi:hypothetical protein